MLRNLYLQFSNAHMIHLKGLLYLCTDRIAKGPTLATKKTYSLNRIVNTYSLNTTVNTYSLNTTAHFAMSSLK